MVPKAAQLVELAAVFLKLGCISFGGPVAHLGYFHEELVRRRGWVDEAHYSDLVALCNFLPGPASSQLVFAIGMERAGLAGALTASLAFLLPSAGLMILCGYGFSLLGDPATAGWLHGLKIAAAAVVAQAVGNMARRLCPDFPRVVLALAAAGFVCAVPGAYAQIGVLAAGMILSIVSSFGFRVLSSMPDENSSLKIKIAEPEFLQENRTNPDSRLETRNTKLKTSHYWAAGALGIYLLLLVLLPALATGSGARSFKVFASFYRAGALVFGGGHVVLPLLRA